MDMYSEKTIEPENAALIDGCCTDAAAKIKLDLATATPKQIVEAIDQCVFAMQGGEGPEFGEEELPQYMLGSLWGQQLVRQLGWEWTTVIFHEHDDAEVVCVCSPDRSMMVLPFHFIEACLEGDADVTIELAFNMLVDGSGIPDLPSNSYENVMANVQHILPRR